MSKFDNSVILPREEYIELTTAAYDSDPMSMQDRIASTVQMTIILTGVAAVVPLATWGWAKATDWRLERDHQRRLAETRNDTKTPLKKV